MKRRGGERKEGMEGNREGGEGMEKNW